MITLKLSKKEMFLIIKALDALQIDAKKYSKIPDIPEVVRLNRENVSKHSEELSLKIWSELISN